MGSSSLSTSIMSSLSSVRPPIPVGIVSSCSTIRFSLALPPFRHAWLDNSGNFETQKKPRLFCACQLRSRHSIATPSSPMPEPGWRYHEISLNRRESAGNDFLNNAGGSPFKSNGALSVSKSAVSREIKATMVSGLAVDGGVVGAPLAIAIRSLALTIKSDRGDILVLKECSLNVPEGQFWMLLGPNGCGKSTLLKAMAGLLRPNRGHMYVVGPRSFVFQNPDHQVVMPTAEADVAFGMGRFDLPFEDVRRRVHESLDAVGMTEYAQRSVQTLSGGQKQRIAIAGALAESSRLLLLDELTTYLDSGDQMGVLEAVRRIVGGPQAVTALWVTHRLEELEYADGAAYMENGRVVLSGSVKDIKAYIQKQQEEFFKGQEVQ